MNTYKEGQRSSYEIQLAWNERHYRSHFDNIENVKRVLTETQIYYSSDIVKESRSVRNPK